MAAKKGGLGKGLDALFGENTLDTDGNVTTLRLTDIEPNKEQPRKQFDEDALSELSQSIAQHGVLQPLLVRPMTNGTYQLVAGERRWRAARMAGLVQVPVVIREMTEKEAAELALIENLQRQDLNPMEEAVGYQTLMNTYGLTQEETARVVNKSRPAVANALRLLSLPASVTELVAAGKLSAGHARTVLAFPSAQQEEVAKQAALTGLSVRQLEKMAKAATKLPKAPTAAVATRDSFYSEVELALAQSLGRRVTVTAQGKGGKLTVEFYDNDDLKALANALAPDN